MKTLHMLRQIFGSHSRIRRIIFKLATYLALIVFLNLFSACSHYFRVVAESPNSAQTIKQYKDADKYFVLHRGDDAWHMYELDIINDSIHAKLDVQLGYQVNYLYPKEKGLNSFHKGYEPDVINAVHIYTTDTSFSSFDTLVSIPVSSIHEVNSYKYARAASRASFIVPAVILPAAGTAIIITLIIREIDRGLFNFDFDN